jgi:hypothetical protein
MNTIDSWAYLWATLAVWSASWLARIFVKTQPLKIENSWFSGSPATLTVLDGDVTRMDVWSGNGFKWAPGQHAFLRFTEFAPLDNHPFTIASAAPVSGGNEQSHVLFLARSHSGFTNKLASYVHSRSEGKESVTTTVWLDGPYGGSRPLTSCYDSLILVAGGTGISACIPWALDFVARVNSQNSAMRLKRCVLVWAVRREDALGWISEELKTLASAAAGQLSEGMDEKPRTPVDVVIRVHITGEGEVIDADSRSFHGDSKVPSTSQEIVPSASSQNSVLAADRAHGRPNMPALLAEFVRPAQRTMVLACGPEGFRHDLANAVAASQTRVLKGECTEIALHLEVFGW